MKNVYLLTTLLTTAAFADSGEEIAAVKKQPVRPEAVATPFIEYNNRMAVFGGFHQLYERTKPDAFYTGVEWDYIPAWSSKTHDIETLIEAELRMGYNYFYHGRDHLTPFAGIGIFRDCSEVRYEESVLLRDGKRYRHSHSEKMETIGYGAIGFLFDHEFDRCICLGANFKLLLGGSLPGKRHEWGNPVVGFDISVPLTFRFGYQRHWDYRIEPFNAYLHGGHVSINYVGLRSTIGYRF